VIQAQICEDDPISEWQRSQFIKFDVRPTLKEMNITRIHFHDYNEKSQHDPILQWKVREGQVPAFEDIYWYTFKDLSIDFNKLMNFTAILSPFMNEPSTCLSATFWRLSI